MEKQISAGFSGFSWALALFCLPSTLWPLGLFISAKFSESPNLTSMQVNVFSILCWVYPVVLLVISGLLYKLHLNRPRLAKYLLLSCFIGFYTLFGYMVSAV